MEPATVNGSEEIPKVMQKGKRTTGELGKSITITNGSGLSVGADNFQASTLHIERFTTQNNAVKLRRPSDVRNAEGKRKRKRTILITGKNLSLIGCAQIATTPNTENFAGVGLSLPTFG